jgi:hypothetical protein
MGSGDGSFRRRLSLGDVIPITAFVAGFLGLVVAAAFFDDRPFIRRYLVGDDRGLFRVWLGLLLAGVAAWAFWRDRRRRARRDAV